MRDYATVSPKFWLGETGKALRGKPQQQLLALYLMTSPHANMIGVFHCPILYMAHETGMDIEGASKALASLIEAGFCTFDGATDEVFVVRMAAYQVAEQLNANDNRCKGIAKELSKVESALIKQAFIATYSIAFHLEKVDKKASPSEAPPKPRTRTGTGTGTGTGDSTPADKSAAIPPGFAKFWETWPTNDRKQAKGKCMEAWKKAHAERDAALVIDHVLSLKNGSWTKDAGQFIPAPLTYINGRRWDGAEVIDIRPNGILAGAI